MDLSLYRGNVGTMVSIAVGRGNKTTDNNNLLTFKFIISHFTAQSLGKQKGHLYGNTASSEQSLDDGPSSSIIMGTSTQWNSRE